MDRLRSVLHFVLEDGVTVDRVGTHDEQGIFHYVVRTSDISLAELDLIEDVRGKAVGGQNPTRQWRLYGNKVLTGKELESPQGLPFSVPSCKSGVWVVL